MEMLIKLQMKRMFPYNDPLNFYCRFYIKLVAAEYSDLNKCFCKNANARHNNCNNFELSLKLNCFELPVAKALICCYNLNMQSL